MLPFPLQTTNSYFVRYKVLTVSTAECRLAAQCMGRGYFPHAFPPSSRPTIIGEFPVIFLGIGRSAAASHTTDGREQAISATSSESLSSQPRG